MRCAALFGGRPERGAAGLANDVRTSHVCELIGWDAGGVWVQLQLALFFLLVEAEPEDTTPSLARRLALIVLLQFCRMRPAQRLVSYCDASSVFRLQKKGSKTSSEQAESKLSKHFDH